MVSFVFFVLTIDHFTSGFLRNKAMSSTVENSGISKKYPGELSLHDSSELKNICIEGKNQNDLKPFWAKNSIKSSMYYFL